MSWHNTAGQAGQLPLIGFMAGYRNGITHFLRDA